MKCCCDGDGDDDDDDDFCDHFDDTLENFRVHSADFDGSFGNMVCSFPISFNPYS